MANDDYSYWRPDEPLEQQLRGFWKKAAANVGEAQPSMLAARSMGVSEDDLNGFLLGRRKLYKTRNGNTRQTTHPNSIADALMLALSLDRPQARTDEGSWMDEYLDWWSRPRQAAYRQSLTEALKGAKKRGNDLEFAGACDSAKPQASCDERAPSQDANAAGIGGVAVSLPRLVNFDAMWESNQAPAGQPAIQTRFEFGQMKEREVDADVPYTITPDRLVLFLQCDTPVQTLPFAEWVCDDGQSKFRVVEGQLAAGKRYYTIDNPEPKTALVDRADWFSFCYVDGRPRTGARLTLTAASCGFRVHFDDPEEADEIVRMGLNKRLLIEQFVKNRALTSCILEQGSYTLATVELG